MLVIATPLFFYLAFCESLGPLCITRWCAKSHFHLQDNKQPPVYSGSITSRRHRQQKHQIMVDGCQLVAFGQ